MKAPQLSVLKQREHDFSNKLNELVYAAEERNTKLMQFIADELKKAYAEALNGR